MRDVERYQDEIENCPGRLRVTAQAGRQGWCVSSDLDSAHARGVGKPEEGVSHHPMHVSRLEVFPRVQIAQAIQDVSECAQSATPVAATPKLGCRVRRHPDADRPV
jgi:hypothetical protein